MFVGYSTRRNACLIDRGTREVHLAARHGIYLGTRHTGLGVGGPGAFDARARSVTVGKDIFPGHPQSFSRRRPGRLDIDEARCHAGDRASRGRDGWAFLFDPSGEIACPRCRASRLVAADDGHRNGTPQYMTPDAMVSATPADACSHRLESTTGPNEPERCSRPLLHAAAHSTTAHAGRPAVDRPPRRRDRPRNSRRGASARTPPPPICSPESSATDAREQSGIWSTASGVLAAYRTRRALASTRMAPTRCRPNSATANTRSTSARPDGASANFAPLVVGERSATSVTPPTTGTDGVASGPPTLLALDEVANIAPHPRPSGHGERGGRQGLLVLACLQDLSQARARWGQAADGFLSLFGTTVFCGGSPTRRRCVTSARSPATVRYRRRQ